MEDPSPTSKEKNGENLSQPFEMFLQRLCPYEPLGDEGNQPKPASPYFVIRSDHISPKIFFLVHKSPKPLSKDFIKERHTSLTSKPP